MARVRYVINNVWCIKNRTDLSTFTTVFGTIFNALDVTMYKYFLSQSLKVAPWPSWTLYYLLQVGTTKALEVLNVLLKLMHLLEEAAELFGKIRKKNIDKEYYGQKLQLTQKLFKDFFPSFFHHVWTRPTYYEYECITYYYTLQSAHTYSTQYCTTAMQHSWIIKNKTIE